MNKIKRFISQFKGRRYRHLEEILQEHKGSNDLAEEILKYIESSMAEGGVKYDVTMWVSKVTNFSSQYNTSTWSANCVIGKPRVYPKYGDIHGAWAQGCIDDNQFLEVQFEEKIFIEKVEIYETFHAGAVSCIKAKGPDGSWEEIWKAGHGDLKDIKQSRIFSPPIRLIGYQTDELRIEQNCQVSGTWCEIDAIQVLGRRLNFDPKRSMTDLASDLNFLVNNKQFSDVTFNVQGTYFYGHKAILVARSDYFRAMFCDQMKEAKTTEPVEFKDPGITKDSFVIMLHFIYTNKIPDNCSCVGLTKVWRIADQFSLEGLKAFATFEINKRVDLSNVVDIYLDSISAFPEIEEVKSICLNYMRNHLSEVVRCASFTQLPQEVMLEVIQLITSKLSL